MVGIRKLFVSVEQYVDMVLDACSDTAVGVPDEFNTYELIEKYNTDNSMETEYMWLGMWMYDKGINLDKDIDKYKKNHLQCLDDREASYKVLTKYFQEMRYGYGIN